MEYLSLGKIIDTFNLDGTIKVFSTTSNGKMRYQKGNKIYIEEKEYTVEKYHHSGNFDFVKLQEINNVEEALTLKGKYVEVIKNRQELKEGYYYFDDLKGCDIIDNEGNKYGIVKEIEEFPAQITLRVKRENQKDFFVPFVKDFIVDVDVENKKITINIVEGLL